MRKRKKRPKKSYKSRQRVKRSLCPRKYRADDVREGRCHGGGGRSRGIGGRRSPGAGGLQAGRTGKRRTGPQWGPGVLRRRPQVSEGRSSRKTRTAGGPQRPAARTPCRPQTTVALTARFASFASRFVQFFVLGLFVVFGCFSM